MRFLPVLALCGCFGGCSDGGGGGEDGPPAGGDGGGNGADGVTAPDGRVGPDAGFTDAAVITDCASAATARTHLGCDFWAVDLWNAIEVLGPSAGGCAAGNPMNVPVCFNSATEAYAGACDAGGDCSAAGSGFSCQNRDVCGWDVQNAPFALVLVNPSLVETTQATITTPDGNGAAVELNPNSSRTVIPQAFGMFDQSLAFSSVANRSFHITSNAPIAAYQYNPQALSISNDASLLLPVHGWGSRYLAVGQPGLVRRPSNNDHPGYLTVVAAEATTLSVTPTADVRAGAGGAPAISSGSTATMTLAAGQAWTLEAAGAGDLTGTLLESPGGTRFAAFTGHVAAQVSTCCTDHLEEQLPPTTSWGSYFAVARSRPRGAVPDRLRILAGEAGTTVTFDPAGPSCPTLDAGERCDVDVSGDLAIAASRPVLVGHILPGTGTMEPTSGDPSLAFAVPIERHRGVHQFLAPTGWAVHFIAVTAPASGSVLLDGADVTSQLGAFGGGSWKAGRFDVLEGLHRLDCSMGCSALFGGYSMSASYLAGN